MVNNTDERAYDAYIGILPKSKFADITSSEITCPLGQLVIASYAKGRIPGLEARVFDLREAQGLSRVNTLNIYLLERELRCTLGRDFLAAVTDLRKQGVNSPEACLLEYALLCMPRRKVLAGITLVAGNIESAAKMGAMLNNQGIDVVVGGPEVTMYGEEILNNKPYFKAAVSGAGEKAIMQIIKQGISTKFIQGGELDFDNINVDYNLLHGFHWLPYREPSGVSYLWGNDCHNSKNRCYFCGRPSLGRGYRKPEIVWQELLDLYRKGIKHFYNTTDTVAADPNEFRRFVDAKPEDMTDDKHKVFINASQVNPEILPYLKKLNAVCHIGIENPALYNEVRKSGSRVQDNDTALALLESAGIPSILSFVIGMPGEDEETLRENFDYINRLLVRYKLIKSLLISPLTVTAGSKAYLDLMKHPDMKEKYLAREKNNLFPTQPPFDVIEMTEDYFMKMTSITRVRAIEWIRNIFDTFGFYSHFPDVNMPSDIKGVMPDEKGVEQ